MHKIIREGLAVLIMAMACQPVFGAECESREAGGVTFSNCNEREPGNVMAGRFESSNAAPERRGVPSAPILAGQKATLVFGEVSPIPAVLSDAELEKARATKPLTTKNKPILKVTKARKKTVRAKSKPSH